MKIQIEVDKIGNIENYKNMPITKDNKVIGFITETEELNYTYLLMGYISDEIEVYKSCDCSMEMTSDYKVYSMEIM